MSFGFSIGDFIAVVQLVERTRKRFADAPEHYAAISDELGNLQTVVTNIDPIGLTNEETKTLKRIIESCHGVLEDLQKQLDAFENLDKKPKDLGLRVRKVVSRFKWDEKEIESFRSRINSSFLSLNTFNHNRIIKTSTATHDVVSQMQYHLKDGERRYENQTIAEWLSPTDYTSEHSDFFSRRLDGTGEWLLNSKKFQAWQNTGKQTLLCPGVPGAGKTIISSIVVQHLLNRFRNDANFGIAYVYCNYRQHREHTPEQLLSSLLRQLFQQHPTPPADIRALYSRHQGRKSHPSLKELQDALHSAILSFSSQVFIIIDALDECHSSVHGREKLLLEILDLQEKATINLFITLRPIPEILSRFNDCETEDIVADEADVLKYIDSRIPGLLNRKISDHPGLPDMVRKAVVAAMDGMFLVAKLHMDALLSKRTLGDLKAALREMPKGLKGLETLYQQAIERINDHDKDSRELARKVMSWVTHARRPLKLPELQHALAVKVGTTELDTDFLPDVEDLVSVCAGLVTTDDQTDTVRWIHYTAQEYFERTWTDWFPQAQIEISTICVTYQLFDVFAEGFSTTDGEFESRLREHILYEYAAHNWGHHAHAARDSIELEQLILDLLGDEAKISASSQARMARRDYYTHNYSQHVPKQVTGLHLGACFGLSKSVAALLRAIDCPDPKCSDGRTPLSWAASSGHEAVVKLLLATCKVDVESKDIDGRTPLSWAASNGHEAVVKLLLATGKVDLESKGYTGWTPLLRAAAGGHEAVVKLLLATGKVDLESEDRYFSWTPLLRAAAGGHEAVVKLLLATGKVNLKSRDSDSQTPLSRAAESGHEAVVKLLLATGKVDIESKDNDGRTPLWCAAANGHEAVVKLLLATGKVDVESKDRLYGQTPLSCAASNGHEAVVKLLLATGKVDVESKDNGGRRPLSWAADNGHEAVFKLLLATGKVDVESKDNDGRTPLWCAAANGHEAVVKLLLATGKVDVESKDRLYGQTPLSCAASNGQEAVVKLLLAAGKVDVESKVNGGQTLLSCAASNGHEAVVKLLLATGKVDVESKDNDGRTPLSWAATSGQEAVVKLLLATGKVDIESKDNGGQTPLWWAAINGHEAVVKLLPTKC